MMLGSGGGGIRRVYCLVLLVLFLGSKGVDHQDTAAVVPAQGWFKPFPCAASKTPADAMWTGCA